MEQEKTKGKAGQIAESLTKLGLPSSGIDPPDQILIFVDLDEPGYTISDGRLTASAMVSVNATAPVASARRRWLSHVPSG